MLVEQCADGRLNQRTRKTRQRRSHPAQNPLIQHGRLGKVGNLRRSTDNRRGREREILKNGPQERRRRDALRSSFEEGNQVRRRIALPPCLPEAVGFSRGFGQALEGHACATFFVNEKEQAGVWCHIDLRVITSGLQFPVAVEKRGGELVRAFDSRAQHRRAHAMEFAPACIQHQQPLRGKSPGIKLREGLGQRAPRPIGLGQRLHRV